MLVLAISCSIIDDGAIFTREELDGLKLGFIEVEQQKAGGSRESSKVSLLYDSVVNIVVNPSVTVVRRVRFQMPSFTNLMLRYRSGSTANNLQLRISYQKNGIPRSWVLFQGDSAVESYVFEYTASGKLAQLRTILDPVDNKPFIRLTRDTIVYEGNTIESIERRSPDTNLRGYFENILVSGEDDSPKLVSATFQHAQYSTRLERLDCSVAGGQDCDGIRSQLQWKTGNNQNSSASIQVAYQSYFDKPLSLQILGDSRFECCREQDTYYFHPFFLIHDNFALGGLFLSLYSIDWFSPGPTITGGGNHDQNVNFKFYYER